MAATDEKVTYYSQPRLDELQCLGGLRCRAGRDRRDRHRYPASWSRDAWPAIRWTTFTFAPVAYRKAYGRMPKIVEGWSRERRVGRGVPEFVKVNEASGS